MGKNLLEAKHLNHLDIGQLKMAEDALVKERAVFKEREEKYRKERVETVEALAQAARTIDGLAERHRRPLVALPSANIPT